MRERALSTIAFGSCGVATTHLKVGLNSAMLPTFLLLRTEADPSYYSRRGLSRQKSTIDKCLRTI